MEIRLDNATELDGAKEKTCTAFAGGSVIAHGSFATVVLTAKKIFDDGEKNNILIFDDEDARQLDADFSGTVENVARRLEWIEKASKKEEPRDSAKPGRPKLGVVSREVTLLPRHWQWLADQPGGASVAIRKLVEQARKDNSEVDKKRAAQEAAYRFMSAMAGNEPGFEEASRAFFADRREQFEDLIKEWPIDIKCYLQNLAGRAF
jgi:hypothetical protein